jgi:hypothetical protein
MPASAMHRPIETRRLKKADFKADFFFIEVGLQFHAAPSERRGPIGL